MSAAAAVYTAARVLSTSSTSSISTSYNIPASLFCSQREGEREREREEERKRTDIFALWAVITTQRDIYHGCGGGGCCSHNRSKGKMSNKNSLKLLMKTAIFITHPPPPPLCGGHVRSHRLAPSPPPPPPVGALIGHTRTQVAGITRGRLLLTRQLFSP